MSAVYRESEEHLAGEIAIAVRVGNGKGRSRLLGIDADARAPQRVPAIVDELRRRGYGDATLVTDGSPPIVARSSSSSAASNRAGHSVSSPATCYASRATAQRGVSRRLGISPSSRSARARRA